MATATQDVSKLPKWAQDRISNLERNLQHAEQQLAIGPEDSDTFANPYGDMIGGSAIRPLGRGELVRFVIDEDARRFFEARIVRENGDIHLDIRTEGNTRLLVEPRASNLIHIRESER